MQMTVHSCVEVKGKGDGCKRCPVMTKGFCSDLIDFIQRAESSSKKKFSGISEFDRLSVIADTVSAIVVKIDTFKGDSQFSTWAWRIWNNKRADFFRQLKRGQQAEDSLKSLERHSGQSPDEMLMIEAELKHIRILLEKDPACSKLLIDFYYKKAIAGESQTEIATGYGLKANTFNQRLKRCRKALEKAIRNYKE